MPHIKGRLCYAGRRVAWRLVLGIVLMGFAAGQGRVEAQEPGRRLTLPGFSIEPLYGNGWPIARPEGFPGLLGYLIIKKIPGWFPIGAEEVPVPLLEWQGASREGSGVEQVVFTKKLSNGQLGATIVRASWTQLAPGNDLLARTMQAREQELRKSYRVLKIETRGDDSVLPDCLRVDALFEGNTEGNQHAVISSRRYLCAHPDAPEYLVDVGFAQQTPDGKEPVPLEEETKTFLKSLRFSRLADLTVCPIVPIKLIPVGLAVSGMSVQGGVAWITVANNWLMQMNLETGKPAGAVRFHHPVGIMAANEDSVWLAKNQVTRKTPEAVSTGGLHFVEHFPRLDSGNAVFAGGGIWTGGCAVASFGCYGKLARIDVNNGQVSRLKFGGGATSFTASNDSVWVQHEGGLARIDASANKISANIANPGKSNAQLLADSRALWVDEYATIWRVDAQTNQVARIDFSGATQSCLTGDTLWVLETGNWHKTGEVSITSAAVHRIDARTGKEVESAVSLETRTEGTNGSAPAATFLSAIQMRACRGEKVWLSDKTGVLLQLDLHR